MPCYDIANIAFYAPDSSTYHIKSYDDINYILTHYICMQSVIGPSSKFGFLVKSDIYLCFCLHAAKKIIIIDGNTSLSPTEEGNSGLFSMLTFR